jgi:hypothetical protein
MAELKAIETRNIYHAKDTVTEVFPQDGTDLDEELGPNFRQHVIMVQYVEPLPMGG